MGLMGCVSQRGDSSLIVHMRVGKNQNLGAGPQTPTGGRGASPRPPPMLLLVSGATGNYAIGLSRPAEKSRKRERGKRKAKGFRRTPML
jgi:hypothetical protein